MALAIECAGQLWSPQTLPNQGYATSSCSDRIPYFHSSSGTWPGRTWMVATGDPMTSWCGPGFCWQFSSVVLYAPAVGIKSIKTSKFLVLLDLQTQRRLLQAPLLPFHKEYQAFSMLFYFKHAVLRPGG